MDIKRLLGGMVILALSAITIPTYAAPIGAPIGTDPFILNFDENGNGSYQVCANTDPNSGCGPVVSDPGTIIGGNLAYLLPQTVITGDVAINDSTGTISDGLRFTTYDGNYYMFYYSTDIGGGAKADTGLPLNFNTSYVGATETGDSFQYFPSGVGVNDNVYNGISASPHEAILPAEYVDFSNAAYGNPLLVGGYHDVPLSSLSATPLPG